MVPTDTVIVVADQYTTMTHYECINCQYRTMTEDHSGVCPVCGSPMQNIGIGRE